MSLQNVEKTEMQMYADVRDLVNTFLRNSGLIVRTPTNYAIGNNLFGLNTSDEDLKAIFLRNLPPQIAITISDINDSIWEIQQWGQTSFQGLTNNTVFMDLYDTRRYGWLSILIIYFKRLRISRNFDANFGYYVSHKLRIGNLHWGNNTQCKFQ